MESKEMLARLIDVCQTETKRTVAYRNKTLEHQGEVHLRRYYDGMIDGRIDLMDRLIDLICEFQGYDRAAVEKAVQK